MRRACDPNEKDQVNDIRTRSFWLLVPLCIKICGLNLVYAVFWMQVMMLKCFIILALQKTWSSEK